MYPIEYLEYLIHFHAKRDYFECHEVLEEYWKEQGMDQKVWVGLIQLAVGLYHHRRNNYAGAKKMLESAKNIIEQDKEEVLKLGIYPKPLITLINKIIEEVTAHSPYTSIHLPLTDDLVMQCKTICNSKGLSWDASSDVTNTFLIHKHTLRDRSDVIQDRKNRLEGKRQE